MEIGLTPKLKELLGDNIDKEGMNAFLAECERSFAASDGVDDAAHMAGRLGALMMIGFIEQASREVEAGATPPDILVAATRAMAWGLVNVINQSRDPTQGAEAFATLAEITLGEFHKCASHMILQTIGRSQETFQ